MPIAFVISCPLCGLVVQGDTENEALEKASGHIELRHSTEADELTLDELRARIEEV
jgi:predicted RNase H-like HicB family nuclease